MYKLKAHVKLRLLVEPTSCVSGGDHSVAQDVGCNAMTVDLTKQKLSCTNYTNWR